ncbi:MAG TPA: OsmC family protein [Candidatus Kapabacteria bacterium]|jgi:putative redox protein|nr:OsmC family protein [Ignavibacteria bacterium]HRE57623.1 OsmC family protein [Candidatus Kapabacteria bacterium]HRI31538.1 OsmC family protein [Candidatus Kapabacteria bacterium]
MIVTVKRQNEPFHFIASNEEGQTLSMDGVHENAKGLRPMQLLLAALGGCSGIDIVSILEKQHYFPTDITITVNGTREREIIPSLFKEIFITFSIEGDIPLDKVLRAVQLSLEKYCSVAKTLEPTAVIWSEIVLNGINITDGEKSDFT